MSTGPTTLEQELLLAAWNSELLAELGVGKPGAEVKHRADAARLRQRAAWVRELESETAIPAAELAAALGIPYGTGKHHQIIGFTNELVAQLTGPIPAATPCAGCLPAEGDYGDGEPPMVLGRHVEGCPAAETAARCVRCFAAYAADGSCSRRQEGCQGGCGEWVAAVAEAATAIAAGPAPEPVKPRATFVECCFCDAPATCEAKGCAQKERSMANCVKPRQPVNRMVVRDALVETCTTCAGLGTVATRWPSGYPHATPCPECRPGDPCSCGVKTPQECPSIAAVAEWKREHGTGRTPAAGTAPKGEK